MGKVTLANLAKLSEKTGFVQQETRRRSSGTSSGEPSRAEYNGRQTCSPGTMHWYA